MNPGDLLFLDAGILGMLAHPRGGVEAAEVRTWAATMVESRVRLFVPEIADYELRRELTRLRAIGGLRRLDQLRVTLDYAPITTPAMALAAELWAESRWRGRPTSADAALDGDVILAAQALTAKGPDRAVMVASPNLRHLAQFLDVRPWREIAPAARKIPCLVPSLQVT